MSAGNDSAPAPFLAACELSGQPLSTTSDEVVVTPSGHVCLKRLLLSKLADNGGVDPFQDSTPLTEDQLISLSPSSSSSTTTRTLPPRPQVTSFPNLLSLLQTEYDALVLELFDTRRALEDTRRELSQALYQNDAATRVVARLAMERDAARQQLQQWEQQQQQQQQEEKPPASAVEATRAEKGQDAGHVQEPARKRARVDDETAAAAQVEDTSQNNEEKEEGLSEAHVAILVKTWETLSKQRKQQKKQLAEKAVAAETLQQYTEVSHKAWHKARGKAGVLAMGKSPSQQQLLVTSGRDRQLVLYDCETQTVHHTIAAGKAVMTCVDMNEMLVVAGGKEGVLCVYSVETGEEVAQVALEEPLVQVGLHPSQQHVVAATSKGRVVLCGLSEGTALEILTSLRSPTEVTYTSGALHPDGLLYAACTSDGEIHLWDFRSQTLASTMASDEVKGSAVVAICFSSNGYHMATATSDAVQVWDLKKQKVLTTLRGEELKSIAFDPSGKYLVYGGASGATVTTVKEWTDTVKIAEGHHVSCVAWSEDNTIISCSDEERQVRFHGVNDESNE